MMFKKNWSFLKKKKSLQTVKLRKVWAKQAKEMTEILVEKKNCQILKSITRHNWATSLSDRERLYDFSVQCVEVCEVLIVSKICLIEDF